MGAAPLLEVKNLVKHFPIYKGWLLSRQVGSVKAVDGISFSINRGDLRSGGRVGMRQVYHRPVDSAAYRGYLGRSMV